VLDDDTARDLAVLAGLVWDDDAEALAPLIDATIVWADEEQLDAIARPIVAAMWADGLRDDIERAVEAYAGRPRALGDALADARADLDLDPDAGRLALAYVRQGAVDLSARALRPERCLCCAEDGLASAPADAHDRIVVDAAVAIVVGSDPEFGTTSRTEDARVHALERLREIGELAARSLPRP